MSQRGKVTRIKATLRLWRQALSEGIHVFLSVIGTSAAMTVLSETQMAMNDNTGTIGLLPRSSPAETPAPPFVPAAVSWGSQTLKSFLQNYNPSLLLLLSSLNRVGAATNWPAQPAGDCLQRVERKPAPQKALLTEAFVDNSCKVAECHKETTLTPPR